MNRKDIYPVILAGGVGERFWPFSRASRPKQLLPLLSSKTLFEETLDRALALAPERQILIMTRKSLVKSMAKILKGRKCRIIGEPIGRNTAPAIAAAAAVIQSENPNGCMVVLSSDHAISPQKGFVGAVNTALSVAQKGFLVVFGIKPSRPDTGYGYIETGSPLGRAFRVRRFMEKPSTAKAKSFVRSGKYLWNSGMFIWKAQRILEEFGAHMPSLLGLAMALGRDWGTSRQARAIEHFYRKAESQSIDFGVLEKAADVAVVKPGFAWDDVGSWEALWRIRKPDALGNVASANALSIESRNSLLLSDEGFVVGAGLENVIVVQSKGATLVLPRSYLPNMRKIISLLKANTKTQRYLG